MKHVLIFLLFFISSSVHAKEGETHIGFDLGYGFLDIGAPATAQRIADLAGSTVTATYDKGAFVGRIYADYAFSDTTLIEVGYFNSGEVNATYKLSGASASEAYSAYGVDIAGVYKAESGAFVKAGIHSSQIDGAANITISGTTYAAQASASGSGFLFGGGFDFEDNSRVGYTYYANLGGDTDGDVGLIYYGWRF